MQTTNPTLQSLIKKTITVNTNTSILEARDKLIRYRISRLVVVDTNDKPIGVITEKDLIRGIYQLGAKPIMDVRVGELMSENLITVKKNQTITDCAKLMVKHGISSIVILDTDETLFGLITKTDMMHSFLVQVTSHITVSKIMTSKVISVSPEEPLFLVESVLTNNKISRIVVQKNKKPIGIITYRDFIPAKTLHWIGEYNDPDELEEIKQQQIPNEFNVNQLGYLLTFKAEDIMTKNPLIINANENASVASLLMIRYGISGIPVVKKSVLAGIVTKSDIVSAMAKL